MAVADDLGPGQVVDDLSLREAYKYQLLNAFREIAETRADLKSCRITQ
jgi:hypothetical protein